MEIAIVSMVVALIGIIVAGFTYWKTQKAMPQLINQLAEDMGTSLRAHVDEQLKPYAAAASTVMSDRGLKGITSRQLKKADELLALDILDKQDPIIQLGLEAFPRLKEYLTDRPDLLPQLLPRLQALASVPGFKLEDLIKPGEGTDKSKDKEWAWK